MVCLVSDNAVVLHVLGDTCTGVCVYVCVCVWYYYSIKFGFVGNG